MFKSIINFLTFKSYPPQVKYVMWNEGAERFAFYGMRAILVMYMIGTLGFQEHKANAIYHFFNAFLYFTPLLGAYLSDNYFGKYKTIIGFSFVYIVGIIILSSFPTTEGLYIGLFLIALGGGGIKPCASAFAGDQLDTLDKNYNENRAKLYSMWYFMVNFGSFFSTIITPITREYFGPQIAFSIPGVLMFIAILILIKGRKMYNHVTANPEPNYVFSVLVSALKNFNKRDKNKGLLGGALLDFDATYVNAVKNIYQILKVFLFIIAFWSLFDQQGSSWINQAKKMDLYLFNYKIAPDLIPFLNPAMVMLMIPLFNKYLYPFVNNHLFNLTPLRKISIGIFISGLSFGIVGFIQTLLDQGLVLGVMWQVIPYLAITAAEVLVSVTGLEFAYSQAPKFMKSTITSFWLLTTFFGNLLAGIINEINLFTNASDYFYFFAIVTLIFGVIFIPFAKSYKHISQN